ncbi:amidase signature domain-containing protein [Aspergillus pseudotamarii]|uniref:Amidase signature domain-containing protein n=1 Tax=Aspergillus pseudotamarii TaxID=132259 RepID=A0A5N6T730_ASPPS|nr:amidase signature domain-containing protein [Aspergillus pseudotamarii]KAE8142070.1 amidase signature domain-containing protein [Aspergillus pseudotamarii]
MNNPQTWKQIASRKEYLRNEMLKPYMVSDVDQRLPQVHSVQERSRPRLTPGGSTGGEAALLALHGTLLGFGTDIGGSTRIPQSIVDLYGLKPTISRLPYLGVPVSTEGQEHVPSSIGPMARDLASIVYVSRSVANAKPWELDPKCTLLPWNEDTFQEIQGRPIVVSLILDDGVGHEVVIWDALDYIEYIQLMDQYYTVDGGGDIRRDIAAAGEPFTQLGSL